MTLSARDVIFAYDPGRPVLTGLSLAVPSGAICVILGANGSGKSTLLKILAGTLRPQAGQVQFDGISISSLNRRAVARRIAVVPQGDLASSFFTVRELVAFGRYPWQGRFTAESRLDSAAVDEALAALHLTALANRRSEALSGGERQRVRVAMALAQQPEVLLLDEPLTYLDLRHQLELLELIADDCRRLGRTVVLVLHDLNLAASHADQLALLADGKVLRAGPPLAVLTAENIAAAYGVEAVVTHGTNGRPHVVLRTRRHHPHLEGPRIHLVGGGGAAANLLTDLAGAGFRISLGVVNQGDLDAAVADDWGLETILVPPASPVSDEAAHACRRAMRDSSAVVVANVPFGPGNLENLRLALEACRYGTPVLLVAEDPIETRDFTGGTAARLAGEILAAGAEEVRREQMVAEWLQGLLR